MRRLVQVRAFHTKSPLARLSDELAVRIVRHNGVVDDVAIARMVWSVAKGGAAMTLALALLPLEFLDSTWMFTGVSTAGIALCAGHFADDVELKDLVDRTLKDTYVTMPPVAIIRAAHDIDGELALVSLLRFVTLYPDSLHRPTVWHAEEARAWRERHSHIATALVARKEEL